MARLIASEGITLTAALERLVSYGAHIDKALESGADVIVRRTGTGTGTGEQEKLIILA